MSKPKLLDQVRDKIRFKHYSIRTENTYIDWIKRHIYFNNKQHPNQLGAVEIEKYLSYLAVERNVSSSTQNVALNAILFLYREVLGQELPWLDNIERAKKPVRLPVVLNREEVKCLFSQLDGKMSLMASLLYGSGLRLMECVRLRVLDIDFSYSQIIVRSGKGNKDRKTMLPPDIIGPLTQHLKKVKITHERDLDEGFGEVYLPNALERKFKNANKEWRWQYIFPASRRAVDPRSNKIRRHHLDEKQLQRSVRQAVQR